MVQQVGDLTGRTRVDYVNGKRVLLVEYVALVPSDLVMDTYPDGYPMQRAWQPGHCHTSTLWRPATEEENVEKT